MSTRYELDAELGRLAVRSISAITAMAAAHATLRTRPPVLGPSPLNPMRVLAQGASDELASIRGEILDVGAALLGLR